MTTVIKHAFPKPALTMWAARKAAEYAVTNWNELEPLPVQEKVDRIRYAHEKIRDDAADIGDAVHETIDLWMKGESREVTRSTNSYLNQFVDFVFDNQPRFIENEVTFWSRTHGYAGTADWIAEIDGKIVLGDNKTGKGIYAEVGLQLSALAGCDFIIRQDGSEEEIPPLDELAALHVRPRSWKLVPVARQQECFEAFLAARAVMRWSEEVSPHVLGR